MPQLLQMGSERMLDRAKAFHLVVPLSGYSVHVYGVSTRGLKPLAWATIKHFWELFFREAGADLITYSPECDVQRSTD